MKMFLNEILKEEKEEGSEGTGSTESIESETTDSEGREESDDDDDDGSEDDFDDESSKESSDLTEEELKESKALYNLLKNPSTRDHTLRVLAEKAGILKNSQQTEETNKTTKTLLDTVKEGLGEKYSFLAPELTRALENVLNRERELNNLKISQLEANQIENQVNSAFEKLARETKGASRKVEAEMLRLSEKFKPSDDISIYEYFEHLYTLASAKSKTSNIKREMAERISKNAKDVGSRLQSSGTASGKSTVKSPKTIKEAVDQAMNKLLKG
jgi:hypothetical protein